MRGSVHSWTDKSSGVIVKPSDLAIVEEGRSKVCWSQPARGLGVFNPVSGLTILAISVPFSTAKANSRGVFLFFIIIFHSHAYTQSVARNLS